MNITIFAIRPGSIFFSNKDVNLVERCDQVSCIYLALGLSTS